MMNGERRLIVVSDSETMSTCAYGCGGFTAGNYWWILTWLLGEVWLASVLTESMVCTPLESV